MVDLTTAPSTLHSSCRSRKSSKLTGYRVVLDPLSDCEEDEHIEDFFRARVAANGLYEHMWISVNIGGPCCNEGQSIKPFPLDYVSNPESLEEGTVFFVTEEPWISVEEELKDGAK